MELPAHQLTMTVLMTPGTANFAGNVHDGTLLKLLDHNEIPYVVVQGETCCGMPKLELGNLDAVETYKERNIPLMYDLAQAGYAIVTPVPSEPGSTATSTACLPQTRASVCGISIRSERGRAVPLTSCIVTSSR